MTDQLTDQPNDQTSDAPLPEQQHAQTPDLPPTEDRVIPELPADEEVVVRRNGGVFLVVASVAAVMSAAYLARAVVDGSYVDWLLCVVLAALTWLHVFTFLDARVPLLVADPYGVRIRLGRTWRGMAWHELEEVEYLPRRGLLRDGKLVLFPRDPEQELSLLGPTGRRHARITALLHGAPFAMPLGVTTRVLGARHDLSGALAELSDGRCGIVVVNPRAVDDEVATGSSDPELAAAPASETPVEEPQPEEAGQPEDTQPGDTQAGDTQPEDTQAGDTQPEDTQPVLVASPTPAPAREPVFAIRSDLARERDPLDPDATQAILARPPVSPGSPVASMAPVTPIAHLETAVIDDVAGVPAVTPVIGPVLAAARQRLHLDVDQLAERTRIRPHVIEAIEIDDFASCGGDFYARGHLRTLARVLGVDVTPLLATYDETYADAPIDPRRVFEAELATGRSGPIRGTRGGPNWSVLVAAVMTVVLAWSVARLVMDDPSRVSPSSPTLADGSAGLSSSQTLAQPVPVVLSAAGGGAHVVVRDGGGKVIFTGSLAFGQSRTIQVAPPVRIQSSDGSLRVTVDGQNRGALGRTGQPAEDTFTGR